MHDGKRLLKRYRLTLCITSIGVPSSSSRAQALSFFLFLPPFPLPAGGFSHGSFLPFRVSHRSRRHLAACRRLRLMLIPWWLHHQPKHPTPPSLPGTPSLDGRAGTELSETPHARKKSNHSAPATPQIPSRLLPGLRHEATTEMTTERDKEGEGDTTGKNSSCKRKGFCFFVGKSPGNE
ncbi:hypothetical protein LZ30DRAFT_278711 [Colletotrichum cereale]|nr:hypothetical protein LZ30DRAFT_278711 [Colletotrichum cereale]